MTASPHIRPRRSALYLPASNARAIEKARTLPADIVILDLEDAVAPDAKPGARAAAVAAAAAGGFGPRELILRVNGSDTPWGADDLAAAAGSAFDAVLLPKVNGPEDIAQAKAVVGDLPVWAMIETCAAIPRLHAIAAAPGLAGMILGLNDLAREMRARPTDDRAVFQPVMTLAVIAARAHDRVILDGVCNALGDEARLVRECEQALAFGCDGKTLIHPNQVGPCNAVFAPDPEAIDWAERVIAAFADPANAGLGALKLDGRMIELLHREEALRVQALAAAIAARG